MEPGRATNRRRPEASRGIHWRAAKTEGCTNCTSEARRVVVGGKYPYSTVDLVLASASRPEQGNQRDGQSTNTALDALAAPPGSQSGCCLHHQNAMPQGN